MGVTLQDIEQEFGPKFEQVNEQIGDLGERLEAARKSDDGGDKVAEITKALETANEQIGDLTRERDERIKTAEFDAMQNEVVQLRKAVEAARVPQGDSFLAGAPSAEEQQELFGRDKSFYQLAKKALSNGDSEAIEEWANATVEKAMTEGTGSAGGYLVPDQISQELLELREQQAVLRPLFSSIQVTSDTLRIPSVTGGLTAGWVAELAEKPAADMTFGEISANVFTKAGLAVVSNQLLQDARPSIDGLINRDLAKRLANVEELAFINGTGSGQPTGILNTAGVQTVALTSTAVLDLLDAIVTAITNIFTNYFGAPNAIVMHPRTWARIVSARESATASTYIVGSPSAGQGRRSNQALPGYNGAPPRGELFGYPVFTTANVPTNLGAGTNESRVIVGNFDEGLILDRSGIELSSSEHVYFSTNQTIFRAEDRMGFTAARYPKAFSVVQGAGLAGG